MNTKLTAAHVFIHMARKECFSYPGVLGGGEENRLDLFLGISDGSLVSLSNCGALRVIPESDGG